MGLSSSKTTSGPSKAALPHLNSATTAVQGAYNSNQGNLDAISGSLSDAFKKYASTMGSGLTGAQTRVNDVLGGKYLDGNPQLQSIIDTTNASVADQVNALFSRAGQSGSSRQIGELGKRLSENESGLRYQSYADEQARMDAAIAQALGLNSAGNENAATLASLGTSAATVPYLGASFLADSLGGLWGNSTTTKSSPGIGPMLLQAGANAAGAIAASDPALKTNIEHIATRADGLGVYAFDYIPAPTAEIAAYMPSGRQIGVMADEVATLRPDALGPIVAGYRTVNYGAL